MILNDCRIYEKLKNIKTERYDGYYSDGRKRPGIKPKIPDEELSPEERHHREKRRLRNKEAASRCRKKKEAQITELQGNFLSKCLNFRILFRE